MPSSNSPLKNITSELKHLSFKRQQLLERKKVLCVFQELRNRAEFAQTAQDNTTQSELDSIDEKLKELCDRKDELMKSRENILDTNNKDSLKEQKVTPSQLNVPTDASSGTQIFYVEAPPSMPAPTVILDVDKLPLTPCKTQCPECRQFVETETFTTSSSVTWLVCLMTALMGCVAGCCLIPFCLDTFKSTTHRCPKCRTSITTIKKL